MAPPSRARSLPKASFSPTFSKLKTSSYTDNPRPSVAVSQTHFIRTLSWNAPGTLIATGAADRTLRIWNPEKTNVKNSTELRGHQGAVERVAFHPITETELASCSSDGLVRFWDVRSKASVGEARVGGEPFTLAWNWDGSEIVVGRKDNILVHVDRTNLRTIGEHHQSVQTNQCVLNWESEHLFLTNGDGCVKILNFPSFEYAHTLNAHTSSCYALSLSPSGEYLAVGGGDALVSLWDTTEWACVRTLDLVDGPVKSVDFSFDGSYVAAGSEEDKRLQIAHTETGEVVHGIELMQQATQVAWHPCRYVLAYSAEGQGLKILSFIFHLSYSTCPFPTFNRTFLGCLVWDNGIYGNELIRRKKARCTRRNGSLMVLPATIGCRVASKTKMDVQVSLNPVTLFSAKGLVVVITGGGSGIGLAIASTLYQNGAAKIYLIGRRTNALEDAVRSLESSSIGPKSSNVLVAVTADVTSAASIALAVSKITEETGYVDILINNAGVTGPNNAKQIYQSGSITELRDTMLKGWDVWGSTFAINTQSVIGVSAAFLPLLEAANMRRGWEGGKVTGSGNPRKQDISVLQKAGADADDDRLAQIITVASVASFMRQSTAGLAYNATKSGAMHLGKMMASFLSEWGIRSNVVCPGPYPSVMTEGIDPRYGTSEIPQGRMGNVNDIAGLTLFLVGKSGAYINGTVQLTDGGRLSVWPSTY
ncbi:WD40 repeat-like protein [Lojkania enalia]|uniref:WD40 repeat-like protein n=1 Tax=Lojkania enalia TaxID=147567 RepID=A0A9P4N7M0_9PLEO|nr:WD40 repeat-like protein [Didymosphaeria enalia]